VKAGWLVGVVGVVVLAYITLNTLRTEGLNPRGLDPGTRLPPFAMPLASSASDKDANIATRPGSGPEGARPACTVRGPEILNVCQLAERGPVVLAFVVTGAGDCEGQLDVLDRVAPRFPDVEFAAVAVHEDHDDLRRKVRERGWRVPVGYDHDGAVANLYGVGVVCPLFTFAGADGRVAGTKLGVLDERELAARVEALEAGRPLPEAAR
jgi:AhpC/TSA family